MRHLRSAVPEAADGRPPAPPALGTRAVARHAGGAGHGPAAQARGGVHVSTLISELTPSIILVETQEMLPSRATISVVQTRLSPLHKCIILTLKKRKRKEAIRIHTSGDTASGNHGARESENGERQHELRAEALETERTGGTQSRVTNENSARCIQTDERPASVSEARRSRSRSRVHSPVLDALSAARDHLSWKQTTGREKRACTKAHVGAAGGRAVALQIPQPRGLHLYLSRAQPRARLSSAVHHTRNAG